MTRAPRWAATLLPTLWLALAAAPTAAASPPAAQQQALQAAAAAPPGTLWRVQRVVDGDTLRLVGGEKLRLIGINTPELRSRSRGAPEPLAAAARAALRSLIATDNPERQVLLEPGRERRDRYGRLLAHARHPDGRLLAAALLREGLGMQALIPPNTAHWQRLAAAEAEARAAQRGVWANPYYAARPVAALGKADAGFRRVLGIARPLGERRTALLMGERLYLPVPSASLAHFRSHWLWDAPRGACVELSGWLVAVDSASGAARLRMALHHPALLRRRPAEDCRGHRAQGAAPTPHPTRQPATN